MFGDICDAVTPLAWAGPEDEDTNSNDPVSPPAKKQTT